MGTLVHERLFRGALEAVEPAPETMKAASVPASGEATIVARQRDVKKSILLNEGAEDVAILEYTLSVQMIKNVRADAVSEEELKSNSDYKKAYEKLAKVAGEEQAQFQEWEFFNALFREDVFMRCSLYFQKASEIMYAKKLKTIEELAQDPEYQQSYTDVEQVVGVEMAKKLEAKQANFMEKWCQEQPELFA